MFKFAMIALMMAIVFMVTLSSAHPSSYGYQAPKETYAYESPSQYGAAQPAPIYGSGYDKKIYGAYEGHPGLYKETKAY